MTEKLTVRHALRWVVVALAALAFATATKAWSELSNDVVITYQTPPGELSVSLFDQDGERLRKTQFSDRLRTHEVVLPMGRYRVEIHPKGHPPRTKWFTVSDDDLAVTIVYAD